VVGECGQQRHRWHDDGERAGEARAGEPRDRASERVGHARAVQRGAQHEDRGDDDRRLAAESRQRFVRPEESRHAQREHDQQRDDVVAQPLGEQQQERRAEDDEENQLRRVEAGHIG